MTPSFLVPLLPPGALAPLPGRRIRWPDEPFERLWNGEAWVRGQVAFDGGDLWLDGDEETEAA